MSGTFVVDTHPLIFWMLKPKNLSKRALAAFSDRYHRLLVPTFALMEIDYLIEIGRIDASPVDVMTYLRTDSRFTLAPFDEVVLSHSRQVATRDPFDRTVVATALAHGCKLLTKDGWMHEHYPKLVIW